MVPRLSRVFLLALLTAGCATADGMQDKLYNSSRSYNRALRWSDYDAAARYLPSTSVDAFLVEHESSGEDVVIVDYEMTRLRMDRQRGTAESRVALSWHTEDRLIVESSVIAQAWQWYEGNWYLVDERLIAGEPLAFVPDLDSQDHPYLPGLERFRTNHKIEASETGAREKKTRGPSSESDARSRYLTASGAPD